MKRYQFYGSDLLVASGINSIIHRAVLLCKTLFLKSRMQIECFLIMTFLLWNEEICWWMSTHTSSFAELGTNFHNGHGVIHPFSGLSDTKDLSMGLLFHFFLQNTILYKKKTLQRQSFSHIHFKGSIWDPHSSSLSNYMIKVEVFGLL